MEVSKGTIVIELAKLKLTTGKKNVWKIIVFKLNFSMQYANYELT